MPLTEFPSSGSASDAEASATRDTLHDLYLEHSASLYRVAYRITGSIADAEDVLQDVFVGLPEALRTYEARGSLEGWLRRVTARVALARIRKRARRAELPLRHASPPVRDPPLSDRVVERTALERALDELPSTLRLVFVLKEAEGYSHAEIAALLRIRPGTSEVRLHRAKQILRTLLESER